MFVEVFVFNSNCGFLEGFGDFVEGDEGLVAFSVDGVEKLVVAVVDLC